MPEEDPDGVGDAANEEEPADAPQARVLTLRRQRLVHGKGDHAQVDDAPDGKDVAGRYKEDTEAVGNLPRVLAVEGYDVGHRIDGDRDNSSYDINDLPQEILVHRCLLCRLASTLAMSDSGAGAMLILDPRCYWELLLGRSSREGTSLS